MIDLDPAEIAAVVGGAVHDGDVARTVSGAAFLDSREIEPGGLFVALAGEHTDGHEYAAAAVAGGAAAVLGSRPTGAPTIVVDDPVAALGILARHVLDRLAGTTVVALTGSQGKTGTKDYLSHVLAGVGETVATRGNLNNEIGVPLTVLRAGPTTRFLVVEMGARGVGHIAYLCGIAPPAVGMVLNVGTAHLAEFGSREAIARAKGEIVEALAPDGIAVLNADDDLTAAMASRSRAPVWTFGRRATAEVSATDQHLDDLGRPVFRLRHAERDAAVRLRLVGEHQVDNALAAATAALALGVPLPEVAERLSDTGPSSRWRMEMRETADGTVVINDSYNANPDSMRSALETLALIGRRRGARTVAVLGGMLELGSDAEELHRGVGHEAARLGIDRLVVVGDLGRTIGEGATAERSWRGEVILTSDRDQARAWVRENVASGDAVLVKASRGIALENVAHDLAGPAEEQELTP
ncbi:UDP-N-acetylmuramoyl-tripeptide--D-alanyl-D-alanine ligase [Nocardioides sp.]|uniref:UDP-N-acetylmuramoyl-tripeptide--D-alanyl-D- alanine ligase n=1 Tax=Nocardioides sp. TaxID=35761 RepID=UPI002734711F|nr:UDP-N-acetylmuramoyl-tripeptide--D-alanyl-D-alanine ligase [Nocardioides sp.]MDP3892617.1 UDP-N-acetylmuramoyl-tripeptide--D-alanyl-D-alanine ligase [Nocardioides sp.]